MDTRELTPRQRTTLKRLADRIDEEARRRAEHNFPMYKARILEVCNRTGMSIELAFAVASSDTTPEQLVDAEREKLMEKLCKVEVENVC